MKVYQRKQHGFGKWLLAGLAFVLVMTVTFADVYGVNIPGKKGGNGGNGAVQDPAAGTTTNVEGPTTQNQPNPSPVPEPATMVLMAVGLGAAALMRTRKKV